MNDPSPSTVQKLQKPLDQLELLAQSIDQEYGTKEFLLSSEIIRTFIKDIKKEISNIEK